MSGETGLCVEVLITEYSVGRTVIVFVVVLRVSGFCVEVFAGTVVTDCERAGVDDLTVVRTAGIDCRDVEKAYTVSSPVATTRVPSALIAI